VSRSKFTEANRAALLDALRDGVPVRTACALVGVDRSAFYRWMRRGETGRPGGVFHDFYMAVQHAIAQADAEAVVIIRRGMRDDPRLARWWLSRRLRDEFGDGPQAAPQPPGPVVIQLTLDDGTPTRPGRIGGYLPPIALEPGADDDESA
jgi:hypothetical protein